ncbi:MAG: hypothetical protein KF901_25005 [Myxococcales bacterium]|nr:hypothetical protein [Myxococcales bacterium]
MTEVRWGEAWAGVRFGLRPPSRELEAGGSISLELFAENRSAAPISLFGFQPAYPRSLRVSPPKAHRPWIRVSFGDTNVLHPPEAFVRLLPGAVVSIGLDLSFAFDRRGAGAWDVAFAYDPVRASGRLDAWQPPEGREASTAITPIIITVAQSLRDAGIDEHAEAALDAALLRGDGELLDRLRAYGEGGVAFAARRLARILSPGAESTIGWRALDALSLGGPAVIEVVHAHRALLPHAEPALAFAETWLRHRHGQPPPLEHLPFVTLLERVIEQPDQRGNFMLAWTAVDSAVHGTRRLQVFGNGERIVSGRLPGASQGHTRRSYLPLAQMQVLVEALRDAAVWTLRPLREIGMPDEPRPGLEVQLALGEPFSRNVALWNGEWRLGPAASLAELLDRLSESAPPDSMPPPSMPPPSTMPPPAR